MANKLQLKHNKNEDFNIENYTNVILAKSESYSNKCYE